ncbi:MAG TPA: type II toxin-antitoxin system RelB/DinJ family antitoxin [Bacteroidota bacterium]|nr:type II toxin-antitoxin system RelB/DinJ family antitoxin [Bacteroidota bacterium]
MARTATVQARVEPKLKSNVETILSALGTNTTDAINIYFKQIQLANGIPFEVKIPNRQTRKAIAEAREAKGK